MVDDAPHEQRGADRHPHVVDADGIEIGEREQPRADRTDDHRRLAADLVRQVADKGDDEHRQDIAHDRDPQIDVFREADPVRRLNRVGGAENRGDHRNNIHQGHADDPHYVLPAELDGLDDRRLRELAMLSLFGEGRSFLDLAANDVARNDDEGAEEEGDPPAIGVERFLGHVMRERQEHGRG